MDNVGSLPRLHQGQGGFTLMELVVTIIIVAIFAAAAAPMFVEVRERAVVRGAASDLVEAVAQAKLEASKRNDFVTVSVQGSGSAWCIGVQTGATGCDCNAAACNVAQFKTSELKGARLLSAADFGGSPASDFSIDPRLGMLRGLTGGGTLVVRSPSDKWDYRLQFSLTTTGQTQLCQPSGAAHQLADYPSC